MAAKLQVALDTLKLDDTLRLLENIREYIDIAEVGTPFLYRSGAEAIRRIRQEFPDLYILSDSKIMDAGKLEAGEQFEAGASCVSVLAVTDDLTIEACLTAAKQYGGEVSADTICVQDLYGRINRLEELGIDIISVHTGVDQQAKGRTPLDDLREVKEIVKTAKISVAGGITIDTVDEYLRYKPDVVIVGGGILGQCDPVDAARRIKERLI